MPLCPAAPAPNFRCRERSSLEGLFWGLCHSGKSQKLIIHSCIVRRQAYDDRDGAGHGERRPWSGRPHAKAHSSNSRLPWSALSQCYCHLCCAPGLLLGYNEGDLHRNIRGRLFFPVLLIFFKNVEQYFFFCSKVISLEERP